MGLIFGVVIFNKGKYLYGENPGKPQQIRESKNHIAQLVKNSYLTSVHFELKVNNFGFKLYSMVTIGFNKICKR